MPWFHYPLILLAGFAAGFVNALAGGGTLISFPILTALGIPAVVANITNTVALVPGYLGATFAQWQDIKAQRRQLIWLIPAAVLGGVIGALLLLNSGERVFRALVPFLILLASVLLAAGDKLRAWLLRRAGSEHHLARMGWLTTLLLVLASIYGGYFGAGLSVIILAVLGLTLSASLTKLNALKQILAFATNIAAALFFVFSGQVLWPVAALLAVSALAGGVLGGRLASKIKPATLRWAVVSIGLVVAVIYFVRLW